MLCQGLRALFGVPGVQQELGISINLMKSHKACTRVVSKLGQVLVLNKGAYRRNVKCWEIGIAH